MSGESENDACGNGAATDIGLWSLADTRIIAPQRTKARGFATDIMCDGRCVLNAVSAGRDHEVAYTRLNDDECWEALLEQAARQWLAALGIASSCLEHHREVWLDWKIHGEPGGIGEEQLTASLGDALLATAFCAELPDWTLMEEAFGPLECDGDQPEET